MKLIARNHGPIMSGAARSRMRATAVEGLNEESGENGDKAACDMWCFDGTSERHFNYNAITF